MQKTSHPSVVPLLQLRSKICESLQNFSSLLTRKLLCANYLDNTKATIRHATEFLKLQPRIMTPSTFRMLLVFLWITSVIPALAFDPLGVVYEVAHLHRRARTLGGSAPTIMRTADSERPFSVDGDTFTDYDSAAQRSCNIQFDNCQSAANEDSSTSFSVEDCQTQQDDCFADPPSAENATMVTGVDNSGSSASETAESTTKSDSAALAQTTIPYDSEFDLVCDL
ncbi:uncharacterized protein BJX67DRAFT_49850 [Aspergillus lucknowensis]|uniref:Uncharacterized protein n=1 Tax=Aspergillus lucknowensis TaxID=176173 RepID=A0ABR4LUK5_9EURO